MHCRATTSTPYTKMTRPFHPRAHSTMEATGRSNSAPTTTCPMESTQSQLFNLQLQARPVPVILAPADRRPHGIVPRLGRTAPWLRTRLARRLPLTPLRLLLAFREI